MFTVYGWRGFSLSAVVTLTARGQQMLPLGLRPTTSASRTTRTHALAHAHAAPPRGTATTTTTTHVLAQGVWPLRNS
jgi:hypothetical protein